MEVPIAFDDGKALGAPGHQWGLDEDYSSWEVDGDISYTVFDQRTKEETPILWDSFTTQDRKALTRHLNLFLEDAVLEQREKEK